MKMDAVTLTAPKTLRLDRIEVPEPGRGQVRIRVEGCGVCGSDLSSWQGGPGLTYPRPPGAPGHEAWGVVESVGADVNEISVGARVAGLFQGAFAEYAVTDEVNVLSVPGRVGDAPFAGEPLACATNAVARTGLEHDDTVLVLGVGFVGAAIVGVAKARGAKVLAVSRRPFAQKIAKEMGADGTIGLDDDVEAWVQDQNEGRLADVVFEVTGKQAPLDLAARLTRIRGTLAIAGYHQDGPRSVDMRLWNWRGLDVVNAHERAPEAYMRGMRQAAALVSDGVVDFSPLYTHERPLDGLDEAFGLMQQRPEGFLKAVVCP